MYNIINEKKIAPNFLREIENARYPCKKEHAVEKKSSLTKSMLRA